MQKKSFAKSLSSAVKRFFRARNVIIISEHKVDHVPLSGVMQVLLLVGMLGLFSGVSYITGSYMAARTSLREKDRKIVFTTIERTRIGEEMDALKHDLLRLSQNGKELSTYSKFLVEEHNTDANATMAAQFAGGNLTGNSGKLLDRISYLESRMHEIQDENDHLVSAIRERTDKKIAYFEDIISMTGLDSDKLASHMAKPAVGKSAGDVSSRAVPASPDTPRKEAHSGGEGGPFIPYDNALNDSDRELLTDVDRLVLLHDIVEKLPLSQPIADAQMTGPFGKRIDPMNGRWAIHPGLDLAGPTSAPIFATSGGKVVAAEHKPAYGNMVDIDHGFGIVTRYAHMSKILVKEGATVRKGQQIGVQGSTGRSTGPHLHYEVRINDRPVNPVKFLQAGEYVLEN